MYRVLKEPSLINAVSRVAESQPDDTAAKMLRCLNNRNAKRYIRNLPLKWHVSRRSSIRRYCDYKCCVLIQNTTLLYFKASQIKRTKYSKTISELKENNKIKTTSRTGPIEMRSRVAPTFK